MDGDQRGVGNIGCGWEITQPQTPIIFFKKKIRNKIFSLFILKILKNFKFLEFF
jgi:hypothetical protein